MCIHGRPETESSLVTFILEPGLRNLAPLQIIKAALEVFKGSIWYETGTFHEVAPQCIYFVLQCIHMFTSCKIARCVASFWPETPPFVWKTDVSWGKWLSNCAMKVVSGGIVVMCWNSAFICYTQEKNNRRQRALCSAIGVIFCSYCMIKGYF